jgi:hypothetical protein
MEASDIIVAARPVILQPYEYLIVPQSWKSLYSGCHSCFVFLNIMRSDFRTESLLSWVRLTFFLTAIRQMSRILSLSFAFVLLLALYNLFIRSQYTDIHNH